MFSLFIDTLSSPAYIALFNTEKIIIDSVSWEGKHAEFDTLSEEIDALLLKNNITYEALVGIHCIVGPGGFTGIRVTTLVANTIAYSFKIPLYALTIQDFFHKQTLPLPWIIPLTKTEVIIWEEAEEITPHIFKKEDLTYVSLYSSNQSMAPLGENIPYKRANNYDVFLKNYFPQATVPLLKPLYARDPNILIRK